MKTEVQEETVAPQALPTESGKTCYVRPVLVSEVRDEIEKEADGAAFSDDQLLYALHAADGSRIALMSNRDIAFAAARQHEMTPLSLH